SAATTTRPTNDPEPLGPEGLALNTGTAIQNTGVAFATAQGGSVTLNANGTFTYISAVGFEGVDTFTYTLRDTGLDAVAGNADDLTDTGTVSITVGPAVWFTTIPPLPAATAPRRARSTRSPPSTPRKARPTGRTRATSSMCLR